MNTWIPAELTEVLGRLPELGRAYLVGGCVRDWLVGVPVKDFDLEVFGITYPQLATALARCGRVDCVGRSFGVIKLTTPSGRVFDFTLPRRDSKRGTGHRGFEVTFDPSLSLPEAAARRDFTINAMFFDPRQNEVLDFYQGQEDLARRVLRHTSSAFADDPLRVLRGMQFAGRFGLEAAPETIALSASICESYAELAVERVRDEWLKWAGDSTRPSAGLSFLERTGWIRQFPELAALQGVPQDPIWHPEGDVLTHTRLALDGLCQLDAWRNADRETRIVCSLAVLTHDFGKSATTQHVVRNGQQRIISPGHELVSAEQCEVFLERIRIPLAIRRRVAPLVLNHMAHLSDPTERQVRRLSRRLQPETIEHLGMVILADYLGRSLLPVEPPASLLELLKLAEKLELARSSPIPILKGKHLVAWGFQPGPSFGRLIALAYQAQLEGEFTDLPGALRWLRSSNGAPHLSQTSETDPAPPL